MRPHICQHSGAQASITTTIACSLMPPPRSFSMAIPIPFIIAGGVAAALTAAGLLLDDESDDQPSPSPVPDPTPDPGKPTGPANRQKTLRRLRLVRNRAFKSLCREHDLDLPPIGDPALSSQAPDGLFLHLDEQAQHRRRALDASLSKHRLRVEHLQTRRQRLSTLRTQRP